MIFFFEYKKKTSCNEQEVDLCKKVNSIFTLLSVNVDLIESQRRHPYRVLLNQAL